MSCAEGGLRLRAGLATKAIRSYRLGLSWLLVLRGHRSRRRVRLILLGDRLDDLAMHCRGYGVGGRVHPAQLQLWVGRPAPRHGFPGSRACNGIRLPQLRGLTRDPFDGPAGTQPDKEIATWSLLLRRSARARRPGRRSPLSRFRSRFGRPRRPRAGYAAAARRASGRASRTEGRRSGSAPSASRAVRRRAASPAAGFDHQADARAAGAHAHLHRHRRLDPPVRRQGRAARRHRLYLLPARRRRRARPPGDLPVQRRARRGLGLAAIRRRRTVAAAAHGDGGRPPPRPICCRTPRPGSTSPISSSSIPSAPATAASSRPARTRASASTRSTATSIRSRS